MSVTDSGRGGHEVSSGRDARARALAEVTDTGQAVLLRMNLAAEISTRSLGLADGAPIDWTTSVDGATLAESSANYRRLRAGMIDAFETFSSVRDRHGTPVNLQIEIRRGAGTDPDRDYIEIAWSELSPPPASSHELTEEVLDVAQLLTSGALADAPIGVALIDVARLTYVTVNHAYAATLGRRRMDLIGSGLEVGRPDDLELFDDAGDVLGVVRGTVDSVTLSLPVPGEPDLVQTATLHAIGARRRSTRYLLFLLLQRTRTADPPVADPRPLLTTPLPDGTFARAVVDADWRLRFIEPPLVALGVERDPTALLSVLPSIHPADLPSMVTAADLVRTGRVDRSTIRVRYRVTTPQPGYLSCECVVDREPSTPDGWVVLTSRLVGTASRIATTGERLRAIASSALAEDDGPSRRATTATTAALATDHGLTPREAEILSLLADGQRVSTIARGLHLTDGTVRNYLSSIFRKVGARSQADLLEQVRTRSRRG